MSAAISIGVYVQPRASKTELAGLHDGLLRIRLAAPPVDGAANAALAVFIADKLGIAKSRVQIVSGLTGRRKVVRIDGVTPEAVAVALQIPDLRAVARAPFASVT